MSTNISSGDSYPSWAIARTSDPTYIAADIPDLKKEYGPDLIVLCRYPDDLRATIAPVEIIGMGILGRCVKAVPKAAVEDIDCDFLPGDTILVCTPPMDGSKAEVLIGIANQEMRYFSRALSQFEALAISHSLVHGPEARTRVEHLVGEIVRYLNASSNKFNDLRREIRMPTGDWDVYDGGATSVDMESRVSLAIKSFAARSLHVTHPLPEIEPSELKAALQIGAILVDHSAVSAIEPVVDAAEIADEPAVAEPVDATSWIMSLRKSLVGAFMIAPEFSRELLSVEGPTTISDILGGPVADSPEFKYHIEMLLDEEYSQTALRRRTPNDTPDDDIDLPEMTPKEWLEQRRGRVTDVVMRRMIESYNALRSKMQNEVPGSGQFDTLSKDLTKQLIMMENKGVYASVKDPRYGQWTQYPKESYKYKQLVRAEKIRAACEDSKKRRMQYEKDLKIPSIVTPDLPYIFTGRQLMSFGMRYCPDSEKAAFDRLNIFVGGYLADLDLSRTMITGSAMAASLHRVEEKPLAYCSYEIANLRKKSHDAEVWNYTIPTDVASATSTELLEKIMHMYSHSALSQEKISSIILQLRDIRRLSSVTADMSTERDIMGYSCREDESLFLAMLCAIGVEHDVTETVIRKMIDFNFHVRSMFPDSNGMTILDEPSTEYISWYESLSTDVKKHALYTAYLESFYPATRTTPIIASEGFIPYAAFVNYVFVHTHLIRGLHACITREIVDDVLVLSVPNHRVDMPPLRTRLRITPGTDVDMAIDVDTDAEFDAIAAKHHAAIVKHHPHAVLKRVERNSPHYNWSITCGDEASIGVFRPVEMYRATFNHVVSHHVGMVSGAYTARFGGPAQFVVSARLVSSIMNLATPNYYYFASRKYHPQDVLLKYYARGFDMYDSGLPSQLIAGVHATAARNPIWRTDMGGRMKFPALTSTGNFSAFSLETELYAIELCRLSKLKLWPSYHTSESDGKSATKPASSYAFLDEDDDADADADDTDADEDDNTDPIGYSGVVQRDIGGTNS